MAYCTERVSPEIIAMQPWHTALRRGCRKYIKVYKTKKGTLNGERGEGGNCVEKSACAGSKDHPSESFYLKIYELIRCSAEHT